MSLKERNKQLTDMLEEMQWCALTDMGEAICCPRCFGSKNSTHDHDCRLAAVLYPNERVAEPYGEDKQKRKRKNWVKGSK